MFSFIIFFVFALVCSLLFGIFVFIKNSIVIRRIKKNVLYAELIVRYARFENKYLCAKQNGELTKYPSIDNYLSQSTYILNNHFFTSSGIKFISKEKTNVERSGFADAMENAPDEICGLVNEQNRLNESFIQ